jgi:hypothetical protein
MMRALTLWQPWGWAVVAGHKPLENRTWPPPHNAMEVPLAIHAGKTWDQAGHDAIEDLLGPEYISQIDDVRGAVIGVATVANAVRVGAVNARHHPDRLTEAERRWFVGPWGWVLRDVRALPEPVPCRGYQMLWTLPLDVEEQVRAQLARAA